MLNGNYSNYFFSQDDLWNINRLYMHTSDAAFACKSNVDLAATAFRQADGRLFPRQGGQGRVDSFAVICPSTAKKGFARYWHVDYPDSPPNTVKDFWQNKDGLDRNRKVHFRATHSPYLSLYEQRGLDPYKKGKTEPSPRTVTRDTTIQIASDEQNDQRRGYQVIIYPDCTYHKTLTLTTTPLNPNIDPPGADLLTSAPEDAVTKLDDKHDCFSAVTGNSYADFYTFQINEKAYVAAEVLSDFGALLSIHPRVRLRRGAGAQFGPVESDIHNGGLSTIRKITPLWELDRGTYTLEVTTYGSKNAGLYEFRMGASTTKFRTILPKGISVGEVWTSSFQSVKPGQNYKIKTSDNSILDFGNRCSDVAAASEREITRRHGEQVQLVGCDDGTATVSVVEGNTALRKFTVRVSGPPKPPPARVGRIGARTVSKGSTDSVNVASYFSGTVDSYSVNSSNSAVATVSVSGSTVSVRGVARGSADITVTAENSGGRASQIMAVTVTEGAAPAFSRSSYTFNVGSPVANGAIVGTVSATDVDSTSLTYSLATTANGGRFAIGSSSGAITVANASLIVPGTTYRLTAVVTDHTRLTDSVTIIVAVAALPLVSAPDNLEANNPTASAVDLSWVAVNHATKYRAEYQFGQGSWTEATSSATGTSYTITSLTCGTSYNFRVSAFGDGTNARASWGSVSTTTSGSTDACRPPAAPTDFSATGSHQAVILSWQDPSDGTIAGYLYRLRTNSDSDWRTWTPVPNSGPSTTSYTIAGLSNGTSYKVQIRARNVDGDSPASAEAKATPSDVIAPAAPTGLAAEGWVEKVNIRWDDPNNTSIIAYEYRLRRPTDSDWQDWVAMADVVDTRFFKILDLTPGTLYRVQIRSKNLAGHSPVSNEASATPTAPPPAKPTGLRGDWGYRIIKLAWTNPNDNGITGYQYRFQQNRRGGQTYLPWGDWTDIAGSDANTVKHTLTQLTNFHNYRIEIRSKNAQGTSDASDIIRVWVPAQPPPPVTTLAASKVDGNADAVKLIWDNPDDPTISKYEVRYLRHNQGWNEWTAISGATATTVSHTVDGLALQYIYSFQIRAHNTDADKGPGDPSNEAKIALGNVPARPTGFTATPGNGQVTLNWTNPNDTSITHYQFRFKIGDSRWKYWKDIPDSGSSTVTFTRARLANGTTHQFQVRAVNPVGISRPSERLSAVPTAE